MEAAKKSGRFRWVLISIAALILIIFLFIWGSSPATEEYKKDVSEYDWIEYVDGEVSGGTKVKIVGEVSEISEETEMLADKDGIYFFKNDDINKSKYDIADSITIYGQYIGNDDNTGFPKIIAKLIETDK